MYSKLLLRPEDSVNEMSPDKGSQGFSSSFVDESKAASQIHTPEKNITKRSMFGNDQEIFVDSDTPLILVSDMNLHAPISTKFKTNRHSFSSNKSKFGGGNNRKIFPDLAASSTTTKDKNQAISTISDNDINKSLHEQDNLNQSSERYPSRTFQTTGKGATPMESPTMLLSRQSLNESMAEEVDVFDNGEKKETNRFKLKLQVLLDSVEYNLFIAIFVFYTLFDNEANTLWFNVHANIVFDVFNIIAICTFLFDVLINLVVTKGYKWSFYFWMDAISAVTIVLDINMISENYFLSGKGIYARAGRGSDIGTKMSRVVRIVRLVRVLKLYKQFRKNQDMREMKKIRMASAQKIHPIMSKTFMRGNTLPPGMMTPSTNARPGSHQSLRSNPGVGRGPRGSILGRSNLSNTADPTTGDNSLRQTKDSGWSSTEKAVIGLSRKSIFSQFHFLKGGLPKLDAKKKEAQNKQASLIDYNIKESRVGKKLSDLTIKRTVLMVLALLLFIPMFSDDFFFNPNSAFDYETTFMTVFLNDASVSKNASEAYLKSFKDQETNNIPPVFLFEVGTDVYVDNPNVDLNNLRNSEFVLVSFDTLNGTVIAANNQRPKLIVDSYLSIGRTFFIIFALSAVGYLLSKDSSTLILGPIGRMIKRVNLIAHNPLLAKEQAVRENNPNFKNETIEVENAIVKIGTMLALGYGEAGATIIAKNVAESGDLDPMLHGRKKMAIFGFCDIRNFTDATEVLQEDVMVFVNSIAEIVHSIVDAHTGAANKNIGDAFLLVWKFPDDQVIDGHEGELKKTNIVVNMADMALMSFFKIYARINRDPTLLEYRSNPKLNSRLPNYKVKMGFGMHIGWAIEGAIGSEFKVDASYLSPNVNMAARLEAATKQYGVPLLYSGELYDRLSKDMKKKSRLIDIVTVKGSIKPIYLYTADMDVEDFEPSEDRADIPVAEKRSQQKERKEFYQNLIKSESVSDLIQEDYELAHMFRNSNIEFDARFRAGFNSYIGGDWSDAKRKFEACMAIRENDGPTTALYNFLRDQDFICPEEWQGYHVLTEK